MHSKVFLKIYCEFQMENKKIIIIEYFKRIVYSLYIFLFFSITHIKAIKRVRHISLLSLFQLSESASNTPPQISQKLACCIGFMQAFTM